MPELPVTKNYCMKKGKKIILTVSILLFVITAGAIYAYREYNRENKDLSEAMPDFTVIATQIINEFSQEEKKASAKYNGKVLSVSGTIKSIDKDEKGYYTVAIGDTASLNAVRCSMDSIHNAEATILKQGTAISVKGICTGYNADEMGLGSDIILNRSLIEKTVN